MLAVRKRNVPSSRHASGILLIQRCRRPLRISAPPTAEQGAHKAQFPILRASSEHPRAVQARSCERPASILMPSRHDPASVQRAFMLPFRQPRSAGLDQTITQSPVRDHSSAPRILICVITQSLVRDHAFAIAQSLVRDSLLRLRRICLKSRSPLCVILSAPPGAIIRFLRSAQVGGLKAQHMQSG